MFFSLVLKYVLFIQYSWDMLIYVFLLFTISKTWPLLLFLEFTNLYWQKANLGWFKYLGTLKIKNKPFSICGTLYIVFIYFWFFSLICSGQCPSHRQLQEKSYFSWRKIKVLVVNFCLKQTTVALKKKILTAKLMTALSLFNYKFHFFPKCSPSWKVVFCRKSLFH